MLMVHGKEREGRREAKRQAVLEKGKHLEGKGEMEEAI
jgi:hypothetical protein